MLKTRQYSKNYYTTFGSTMAGRSFSNANYRFKWNGKEAEPEMFEGCLTFEARIFDNRICRWLSTDPREGEYAWQSTYAYFSNSSISVLDFLGMGADDPPCIDNNSFGTDNKPLCSLPILEMAAEPCNSNNINSDLWVANPYNNDMSAIKKALVTDPTIMYQSIESKFTGEYTNIDYYSIRIDKMPTKTDAIEYTPEELFAHFRDNLIKYVGESTSTELEFYGSNDKTIWGSNNYNGALLTFNMNFPGTILNIEDGTVMAFNVSTWNFTFGTMTSLKDKEHPVAGNRMFGIQSKCVGEDCFFEIYIRGIDKVYSLQNILTTEEYVFSNGEKLWKSVINSAINDINKLNGEAKLGISESYRCK